MKKQIYLYTPGEGWEFFDLDNTAELEKRGIRIAGNVAIGCNVRIGNGVRINENAAIGKRATIDCNVTIGDGTTIDENVRIGSGTRIGESVSVGEYARVGESAWIGDHARIGVEARIDDNAWIGDSARIDDNQKPKCAYFTGSRHFVAYWGENKIQVGYRQFSIAEWKKNFERIGEDNGYSPEEIAEYGIYINAIAQLHEAMSKLTKKETYNA